MIHNMTGCAVHYWSGELSELASKKKDIRLLLNGCSEKLMVRAEGWRFTPYVLRQEALNTGGGKRGKEKK